MTTYDQLDVEVKRAQDKIREQVNDARYRLNLPKVEYPHVPIGGVNHG